MSAEEIAKAFVQHYYQSFDSNADSLAGLFVSPSNSQKYPRWSFRTLPWRNRKKEDCFHHIFVFLTKILVRFDIAATSVNDDVWGTTIHRTTGYRWKTQTSWTSQPCCEIHGCAAFYLSICAPYIRNGNYQDWRRQSSSFQRIFSIGVDWTRRFLCAQQHHEAELWIVTIRYGRIHSSTLSYCPT